MSQILEVVADTSSANLAPTPIWQNINGLGNFVSGSLAQLSPGSSFECQIGSTVGFPLQDGNVHIELSMNYNGDIPGILVWNIELRHAIFGVITQLSSGSTFGAPPLQFSADILKSTLVLFYGTDDITFFTGLSIFFEISGNYSPIESATIGVGEFTLSVPDSISDIDFTGTGGVELDSEADIVTNIVFTGSGGVEVAGAPQTVLSADCTGIYTLIVGQHFDRIYSRNTDPAQTDDVKIPDPFGKSGFIGS